MRIDVLTLFPGIFQGFLKESLLGKAVAKGLLEINILNIRSFSKDKHKTADDQPYGGGPGMVMKIEPIYEALKSIKAVKTGSRKGKDPLVLLLTPQGKVLNQEYVKDLAVRKRIVLICGHYEGVDERITRFIDGELSIGDYVLNGGEVPAMIVIESVARMIPGFMRRQDSMKKDSFFDNVLDWPAYTRPAVFKGLRVPEVLMSGHQKNIHLWRQKQALLNTKKKKPYLLKG